MRHRLGSVIALGGLLGGIALASTSTALWAQRPRAVRGRFEIPGMDWGPRAAWRVRAQIVRDARWTLLRQGDLRSVNAARPLAAQRVAPVQAAAGATAVTGTFYVPVIPLAFKDVPVDYPISDFQNVLFATVPPFGRPYSVKTYYEQVSHGMISMFGRVFDPVRTDSTAAYYEQGCNGIGVVNTCPDGGRRFGLMLLAALDSISNHPGSDTVWSQFDNDGPDGRANSGDDDGVVDFVTFLQPVRDGACGGSGIWAHRFEVSAWNGGSPYLTKTPRRNTQGQPVPGQFIKVDNYTMQSQVGGASGCDASQIMPVGTIAHETGHAFGLPDLYDTDRAASGTEGIGEWGIMGSGSYTQAYSPTGFDAWSLNELGWVTVDTLGTTRTVVTGPRQLTDTVFLAPTGIATEYVLIENRQAIRSDTAMLNPAAPTTAAGGGPCRANCRKAPGLLVWYIDLARIALGRLSNTVNTGPVQGVELIQPDGLDQLRTPGGNRGDGGDVFTGGAGADRLTLTTDPAARTHSSQYDGFIIDQVAAVGAGAMRFRLLRRNPSVVTAALAGAAVRVSGRVTTRFEDVVPQGDQLALSADSVQTVANGRTHARFLAWSNGGPRVQTVTSGATPDTVIATFAAEHRLTVVLSGSGQGAVTADRTGDLAAGFFVSAGNPVVVTAAPAAGSVFAGWRGDSSSASPTLTLPMAHPYDLEAAFVTEVVVPVADATEEILGVATLTDQQKVFLDQLGNRNGLYDVGDFLALLRRNGQAAPPAVMRAVAAKGRPGGKVRKP